MDDGLIAGKRSRKAASLADDRAEAGDLGAIEADVPDRPGRPAADIGQLQLRAYVAAHTTNLAIVTDGDGRIVWANEAFEFYTGFDLAEVIGKKPGSFLQGENTDQETVMAMRRAVANREFCQFDIINYTKAGEPYWVDLRISPVFDDKGVLINMISIAQDISDRKAAEARLEALNIDLHRSNQELEQFASIASHDLGEPLRMIAGFVDLLDARYGAKVGEDGRELIGFAADGARRMQQMMQDLLTLAKVGSTGTRSEALNARQPVDSALSNLSLALEDAGGTVSVGALPDLWGNHWQLTQLFQNLIGNAIKFRSDQPLEIKIDATESDRMHRFVVADNGIGIQATFQDRIFDVFRHVNSDDRQSGSGMGLAICRKIVERQGGRIWVESEPGEGSRFFFTLPLS